MTDGEPPRPGARELRHAGRAAIVALLGWFFATLLSGTTSITAQSVTFLLWLATLLAAATCVLALVVAAWKRQNQVL